MRLKAAICAAICCLWGITLIAQTDSVRVTFELSARYRFERWDGMNARNYGDKSKSAIGRLDDNILYQRITGGVSVDFSKKVSFLAHLQDSRAFGWALRDECYPHLFRIGSEADGEEHYTMNPGEEYFEIYDLLFEYREIAPGLSVKAGRQKICFGDNHIFGPGDWGNTGRWTWDALRLSWQKGEYRADLFGGGTKIHDPLTTSFPFTNTEYLGGGFYGHLPVHKKMMLEPFYALKRQGMAGFINRRDINRQWIGMRANSPDSSRLIYDFTYWE